MECDGRALKNRAMQIARHDKPQHHAHNVAAQLLSGTQSWRSCASTAETLYYQAPLADLMRQIRLLLPQDFDRRESELRSALVPTNSCKATHEFEAIS